MQTMTQFHKSLTTKAAKSSQAVRKHANMKIGHIAHQGDVYVIKIEKKPAPWSTETTNESRQIALGATIGSRHLAEGEVHVFWPENREQAAEFVTRIIPEYVHKLGVAGALACVGPIVVASATWTLTHPEHAHHELPAGVYLTAYQLDRLTMREVRD